MFAVQRTCLVPCSLHATNSGRSSSLKETMDTGQAISVIDFAFAVLRQTSWLWFIFVSMLLSLATLPNGKKSCRWHFIC